MSLLDLLRTKDSKRQAALAKRELDNQQRESSVRLALERYVRKTSTSEDEQLLADEFESPAQFQKAARRLELELAESDRQQQLDELAEEIFELRTDLRETLRPITSVRGEITTLHKKAGKLKQVVDQQGHATTETVAAWRAAVREIEDLEDEARVLRSEIFNLEIKYRRLERKTVGDRKGPNPFQSPVNFSNPNAKRPGTIHNTRRFETEV
ncbi:hypothetical protein [Rhodopirellula sp. SWK7]|uniref:hypothetical protein n=1 Tax=Rhodopirellula sp. SWK7 TaxID=595460 RepID=UPI0002BF994D|nr:hypothetical protein [Rhodopirellula sp. SWK7]EMI40537.1 hypothetical protein RRSWK_06946 [Rhodopirellula sp. SWK7]